MYYTWHRKSLMGKIRELTIDPQWGALVRKMKPTDRRTEIWTFYEKGVCVT